MKNRSKCTVHITAVPKVLNLTVKRCPVGSIYGEKFGAL